MDIAGARILLTGATGGLGHAIARDLHRRGGRLVLSGRRVEVLEPLAEETGATVLAADLTDRDDVARLADEAREADVLVANAALPGTGRLDSWTVEEIERVVDVNLRAPIVLAQAAAEGMRERGRGAIVFMSSLAGKSAQPSTTMYCATKFGLRGFALSLRAELHGTGIGVTAVYPGFISDAGMFADSGVELPRMLGTKPPDAVARAVARAIEKGPAEIDVAPVSLSVGARLSGVAPGFAEAFARRFGGSAVTDSFAERQATKR